MKIREFPGFFKREYPITQRLRCKLFSLLNNLYEICEWMILWYGDEYDDLDVVHTKNELIDYVQHCIEKPGCELYIQVCKS